MRHLIPPHSPAKIATRALLPLGAILAVFVVFTLLAAAQTGVLHAQTPEPASQEGVFTEDQARKIDRMLMCPVCPAQTIDQSQVQIALQMRVIVRDMLADGKAQDDVLEFFVDRYGNDILAFPPKSGFNLVAWLLPAGGVAAALVAVFFIIRSMTRRERVPAAARPAQDPGLISYLQLVDRHLDMTRGGPRPVDTSNQPGPGVELPGTGAPAPEES